MDGVNELTVSVGIGKSVAAQLQPFLPNDYNFATFEIFTAISKIKEEEEKKQNREIILLWDEFQILVEPGAESVRNAITSACKTLIDSGTIWSTLAFGTFHLQFLDSAHQTLSPFHQNAAIYMLPATAEDMRTTILEWIQVGRAEYRITRIADEVIESWIANCVGGPLGIFSFIGYQLDALDPTRTLSYQEWNQRFHQILSVMATDASTFRRMLSTVQNATCKNFIRPFLLADQAISLEPTHAFYREIMLIASAGVFNREVTATHDIFSLSCPVVKHLVLTCLAPKSPPIEINWLNPEGYKELVIRLMNHLVKQESRTLQNPLCWKAGRFPSEVTFQSLFFSDIKLALRESHEMVNYVVLMEARHIIKRKYNSVTYPDELTTTTPIPVPNLQQQKETTKRSDIYFGNGKKVVLELKSNVDFYEVRKGRTLLEIAVEQVAGYANNLGLSTAILLNVTDCRKFNHIIKEVNGVHVYVFQAQLFDDFKKWQL